MMNDDIQAINEARPPRRGLPVSRQLGKGELTAPGLVRLAMASPFFRGNALLFAANLVTGAVSYLYHPVVGHLLGQDNYGRVASLVALSTIILIPAQIITTVIGRHAATAFAQRAYGELHGVLRSLTLLLLAAGVLVGGVFIALRDVVAAFLKLPSTSSAAVLGLLFLVSFVNALNMGTLQGLHRFAWFAGLQFASVALRVVLAAGLVLLGWGVDGAVLALCLSTAIAYGLSIFPLWQRLGPYRAPSPPLQPLLRYSTLATVAMGVTILLTSIDTILAKHFLSDHDAGAYAALAVMGKTVLFVSSSVAVYMFPKVSAMHAQGQPHRRLLIQSLLMVLLLSSCALAVFMIAPHVVVRVMYGVGYMSVAPLLVWYGLAMLLYALANILIYYYLSLGRRIFVPILLLCGVLQPLLIVLWHQDPATITRAMVVAMLALLVGMAVPLLTRLV